MFTIYSKDNCGYCVSAKQLLDVKSIPYREIKLDKDITREALLEAVKYYGHGNTMPMIVREDGYGNVERVGGFTELNKWLQENEI